MGVIFILTLQHIMLQLVHKNNVPVGRFATYHML